MITALRLEYHGLPAEAAGLQPSWDEHKTTAELADFAPVERRCRVCQDPAVRRLVNDLLDWRGTPIPLGHGKARRVTYADILRHLEPLNEGRDKKDRITYAWVWNHARRHYDALGTTAYFMAQVDKMLRDAFGRF